MEAEGAAAIDGLMSFFWDAITKRKTFENIESERISARAKYGYALISPNYIEAATSKLGRFNPDVPRYRELRLLTDMVSGMTDTFAIRLWEKVRQVPDVASN
jgi:dGTPase